MDGRGIWIIARLTFREAVRRRIVLGAAVLGLVFLLIYGLGIRFIYRDMVRSHQLERTVYTVPAFNFLTLSGLYTVNFLTLVLTVLTSVDTIAGEIDSGTIHTLAAKPVRRRTIVLGKWLGFVGMLGLYLWVMAGGVVVLSRWLMGYALPHPLRGLALMWLSELVLLNVTLLGGTRLSALTSGVLVFAAYGIAFIGGWIEQIGAFLGNEAAQTIGILSSLLMPSEALWKRAAYEMRSVLTDALPESPLLYTQSVPSQAMIVYAGLYAIIALGLTLYSFRQRDL
jgi:ABC-type transport system involved in multi-copper enzyme maturation permease subunit